ncbi:LicD family protein [Enterocloster sp. OA13]|uniref:LicD family protein n=1 Tax=Enterocloster sp. OA13 TaxID=2914161 RepID=UPI00046F811A|nr:LicD family protein [Enterocloster sp. OA13]
MLKTENQRHVLTETELKRLQGIELELLVEFDRICRKHGIIYSIDGGTLLGAVRHGGFIPWDDDADVIMVRFEYEKFRSVVNKELNKDKFYFQDMDNTPGYRWGYGKLRRNNSSFIRLNQEHMPYEQGIFMDIFVCDNVPDNYYIRSICNFISFIYRKFFWSKIGMETERGIKKYLYWIMAKIPEKRLKYSYRKYVRYRNKKMSNWVKCLTFPACNKSYGYKREWYEDTIDIPFENVILKGSRKKEEYLHFLYGDFMSLPPIEKRKVHPVSKIEFPFAGGITNE